MVFQPRKGPRIRNAQEADWGLPTMKVVVSCLTETGATVNVSTAPFPVSIATATDPGGDGMIETRVALPATCIAPVVFVTTTTDRWLAVNGL